jgi:hypothetical protein
MCEGRRSDPVVVGADGLSSVAQIRPERGMHSRDRLGDRQSLEACEEMLDEGAPVSSPPAGRTVHAVEQLADRDNADGALLVAYKVLEHPRLVSLPLDENVCVDQNGQASSGGPTERRIARTSSAKSSSTGGADRISSLNRSADRTRAFEAARGELRPCLRRCEAILPR